MGQAPDDDGGTLPLRGLRDRQLENQSREQASGSLRLDRSRLASVRLPSHGFAVLEHVPDSATVSTARALSRQKRISGARLRHGSCLLHLSLANSALVRE